MKYFMLSTPTDNRVNLVKKLIEDGKIHAEVTFVDIKSDEGKNMLERVSPGTILSEDGKEMLIKELLN